METEILTLFEEYDKNAKWFRENYEGLVEKYDGMFIAVYGEHVVEYDRDLDGLVEKVSKKYPSERVFIDFVTKEKLVLVL